MANSFFQFKQFTVHHDRCAMKVTTDACLFGAWVAREMKNSKCKIERALDIGTGSGLLSLIVAQQNPFPIDAVEIDEAAAAQAQENVQASGFQQIRVMQKDVLQLEVKQYDCIFSNPPFYETELASPNAKRHIAQHGSGLRWEDLFTFIREHLTANGRFYLLLPYKRQPNLKALLSQHGFISQKVIYVKPTPAHTPTRILLSSGFSELEGAINDLAIKDLAGNYTPEFTDLLKDYYLYL